MNKKKAIRKAAASVLAAAVLLFAAAPLTAMAETPAGVPLLGKTSSAADIFSDEKKAPSDYAENGAEPFSIPFDENTQLLTENELFVTSMNGDTSGGPCFGTDISAYDSLSDYAAKTAIKAFHADYPSDTPNYLFYDMKATAFDPDHTGQCDHIAYLAAGRLYRDGFVQKGYRLMLLVVDTNTEKVVLQKTLATQTKDYSFSGFDIDTGRFEAPYDDTLVVSYHQITQNEPVKNILTIYGVMDGDLYEYRSISLNSLHPGLSSTDSDLCPVVASTVIGDYDRDGLDEIAVIATPREAYDPAQTQRRTVSLENYTSVVAFYDVSQYHEFVLIGKETLAETDDNLSYRVLYYAEGASGDFDGDGTDELMLAGYPGTVTNNGGSFQNTFVADPGKIAICAVRDTKDGGVTPSKLYLRDMNAFTASADPTAGLMKPGVAMAYMSGCNAPATLFAGGSLYNYDNGDIKCVYTYARFTSAKDAGASAVFLDSAVSGNFTKNPLGRQSFAFLIEQCMNKDDERYSVKVGTLSALYDENGEITGYSDNSSTDRATYEFNGNFVPRAQGAGVSMHLSLVSGDIGNDGTAVRYAGTEYVYADPEVVAVLEASPYFRQLGGWSEFMGTTSYSITTSYAETQSGSHTVTTETGTTQNIQVGFIATVAETASEGWSRSDTTSWSSTYTTSYTSTFTAGAESTVVIRRIPIQAYKYLVRDNTTGDWVRNPDGSFNYATTLIRLKPVFYQLTIDEYNDFVAQYNALVSTVRGAETLYPIRTDKSQSTRDFLPVLPLNATGNPGNYDKFLPAGGEFVGSATSYSLGHGGGSIASSADSQETSANGVSFSEGIHTNSSVMAGASGSYSVFSAQVLKGWYIDESETEEHGSEQATSNSYTGTGLVGNITNRDYLPENLDYVNGYSFVWQFARWSAKLSSQRDAVPVYGYVLSDVRYPGQTPRNINAAVDDSFSTVTVTWEAPEDVAGSSRNRESYTVYRMLVDGPDGSPEPLKTVSTDTFTFREPFSNLQNAKMYRYYVSADYTDNGGYSSISTDYSTVIGATQADTKGSITNPWLVGEPGNEAGVKAYILGSNLFLTGNGRMQDFTAGTAPWYPRRAEITGVLVFPGVRTIGAYAFQLCDELTSLTFADSVEQIGAQAFGKCSRLNRIEYFGTFSEVSPTAFKFVEATVYVTGAMLNAGVTLEELNDPDGEFQYGGELTYELMSNGGEPDPIPKTGEKTFPAGLMALILSAALAALAASIRRKRNPEQTGVCRY